MAAASVLALLLWPHGLLVLWPVAAVAGTIGAACALAAERIGLILGNLAAGWMGVPILWAAVELLA